jgi:hypothetical protein
MTSLWEHSQEVDSLVVVRNCGWWVKKQTLAIQQHQSSRQPSRVVPCKDNVPCHRRLLFFDSPTARRMDVPKRVSMVINPAIRTERVPSVTASSRICGRVLTIRYRLCVQVCKVTIRAFSAGRAPHSAAVQMASAAEAEMTRGLARLGHHAVAVEREVVAESQGSGIGDGSGVLVVAESDTGGCPDR